MTPNRPFVWLTTVDSTNRHARAEFANLADGTLVVADLQTAGRGRRGRPWQSPPGCNLYATLVLKHWPHPPGQATWFVALATLDQLRATAPKLDLWLKWPNDILCGDKKLCGILCETMAMPGAVPGILAGIGVNLNMSPAMLATIDRPATSLLAETGCKTEVKAFAVALGERLLDRYRAADLADPEPVFQRWRSENRVIGQTVHLLADNGRETTGIVADLDRDGALLLIDEQGCRRSFHSGEVSLRLPVTG